MPVKNHDDAINESTTMMDESGDFEKSPNSGAGESGGEMDTTDDDQAGSSPASEPCEMKQPDSRDSSSNKLEGLARNTVILFDYDDTVLASSFLSGKGYRLDTVDNFDLEVEAGLKELEQSVIAMLTLAMRFGHVHIVTNAETGWVQLSAQKFIPAVLPLLSKCKVISARSTYEGLYPEAPVKWKYCAFQEALNGVFGGMESKVAKNVISFGDSHVEREAVRAVTRGFPNVKTKSVKFAERPSMEQLRRQMELVTNCFQFIVMHSGDLDLQLTVTVNSASPSSAGSATSAPQQEAKAQPAQSGAGGAAAAASKRAGLSAGGVAAGCKPLANNSIGAGRDTRIGVFS